MAGCFITFDIIIYSVDISSEHNVPKCIKEEEEEANLWLRAGLFGGNQLKLLEALTNPLIHL